MTTKNHATLLVGQLEWRHTKTVCALSDSERHLGHIYKIAGKWHAYDATRLNEEGNSFLLLGQYPSLEAAQEAIERSVGRRKNVVSFAGAA